MALFFGGSVAVPYRRRTRRQNVPVTSIIAVAGLEHVAIAGDSLWVNGMGNQIYGRSKVVQCGSRIGGLAGFTESGTCNFVDKLDESLRIAETLRDVIYEFRERAESDAQRALLNLRALSGAEIEEFVFNILIAELGEDGVSGISASMTVDGLRCEVGQERWVASSARSTCYIAGVGHSVENFAEPLRTLLEEDGLLAAVGNCTIPTLVGAGEHETTAKSLVQRVIENEAEVPRPDWWKSGVPLVVGPITVVSF